jgi:hypothetical protein
MTSSQRTTCFLNGVFTQPNQVATVSGSDTASRDDLFTFVQSQCCALLIPAVGAQIPTWLVAGTKLIPCNTIV